MGPSTDAPGAVSRTVEALLFDLDGTLIDSMPIHHEAWRRWHDKYELEFDEDGFFEATAGRTNPEILADMLPERGDDEYAAMGEEKEELYRAEAAHRLEEIAGALAFIERAQALGLKVAICTAASRENIHVALERFPVLRKMDTVVCPSDGFRGKPHPDLFLEAARRLGVDPGRCIVFEDAPLGLEAARRAGMPAIALTSTLPAEQFDGHENLISVHPDFRALDLERLIHRPPTFPAR